MNWSDKYLLKVVNNHCKNHLHKINCPEVTFYGFPNQPDFVKVTIEIVPHKETIELKSLKIYLLQFRDKHMSYERILDVIYKDIITVYKPIYLKVIIETQPRGGISSILVKE